MSGPIDRGLTNKKRSLSVAALATLTAFSAAATAQSLYNEAAFQSLTADRRAWRAGDVLTVLVYENASASTSADTVTEKSGGLTLGAGTAVRDWRLRANIGDEFTGKGRVQRSGRLAAQITVTVQAVQPNGDLQVEGLQEIVVNGEKQLLQLYGKVRPTDINDANTVASTRLADARITYVGDGILAEKQQQGVLTRFLSWLGVL